MRKKKGKEAEEAKPLEEIEEPTMPSGDGHKDTVSVDIDDLGVAEPSYDANRLAELITEPKSRDTKHIMSTIHPHQVRDLVEMDFDAYLADPDDMRLPSEVIQDSTTKWQKAVGREAVKDVHRLVSHMPSKEKEDKEKGSMFKG